MEKNNFTFYQAVYDFSLPTAKIGIVIQKDICRLHFVPVTFLEKQSKQVIARQVKQLLTVYFQQPIPNRQRSCLLKGEEHNQQADPIAQHFTMAISALLDPIPGTSFQRTVWQYLQGIPYGQVRTYGQLAKELGTSPRAIGQACHTNPLPLLVPCHRVVAATHLGGYAEGVPIKEWLLRREAERLSNGV